ncbi:MAG: hypothetical protein BWX95_00911 [Bacteroidetes bacterium ADurb.Bin141]|nr:DUF4175 domain-containing protein [Bacteroidota bacterium]MCB8931103.1 DUF4175 domain-containing protein [Bacteroidia bacterium]MCW5930443.1 DUF4175 domain-containing protein [Bacteroidota bacterium]OQB63880.1 MAG: hypothetical protein BWX95_00911 [Bacteroidetes bacterium ADurb.Bin141]
MSGNYSILIQKLDEFIRKYYRNQVIKGCIYATGISVAFFLFITIAEHFAWMSPVMRAVFFYLYLAVVIAVLVRLVIIPLLKMMRLGKVISYQQASAIIGNHFAEVKDKLLNTLQLNEQLQHHDSELLRAGIEQKIKDLNPVPFSGAIDLSKNKKYLPYALLPLGVLVFILFAAPNIIKDGTTRLVHYNETYHKPAPFVFEIKNKELTVIQQNDFTLTLKVSGAELPDQVYLKTGDRQFKMDKEDKQSFTYTFHHVVKNTPFQFFADGFYSDNFELKAVPNPTVLNFNVEINYPAYLGRKNETLKNTGDLQVPAGTYLKWNFKTENTNKFSVTMNDSVYPATAVEGGSYQFSKRMLHSATYSIATANDFLANKDTLSYSINVIPDQYPTISVEEQKDSLSTQRLFFRGLIKDDYGFSKLAFHYRFLKNSNDTTSRSDKLMSELISINKNTTQNEFFHYWDASTLGVTPGDQLEYYFEVWDNDGVSGPKSARSQTQIFKAPTLKELAENTEKTNENVKKDLQESLKQAQKIQKQIAEAARKLLDKKNPDYEDKKRVEELLRQQKELDEKLNQIKTEQQQNLARQNEYKNNESQLAEKQQQIQELFDRLQNPELKELMRQLEQMMAQLDKQKVQDMLDKMKMSNKDLEKQMDRTLELFKQLELEQKLQDAITNLDKLAEDQKKLSDKSKEKNADSQKLKEEQNELNKQFEELKKDIAELEKKNQEMEFPQELANTEQEQKDIEQDMQQSEQELNQNNKSKASESQKKASEKMQSMSNKMKQQMAQSEQEQAEEDMASLRYLLENLLRFSFDQEALMEDLRTVDVNNPSYIKSGQQQKKLQDDFKIIEDSLFALSKRVVQIQHTVNTEISAIESNIQKSIAFLQERQVPVARSSQQYVMTSANNLALLLSEALEQMQQQQQQQKQGNGSCKKPGKGKPGPSAEKLKMMQQQLTEQMKNMKGKLEGMKKNGGKGDKGMSEELARMAAQQEAIRNGLNELNQQENKDGKNSLGNLGQLANQMEQNERDIVNKRITEETLKRQQEILTRLLEAENAQREREQDQTRKAEQAKEQFLRNPAAFEEYKKLKEKQTELLNTVPPGLNTFYKNLVNNYFQGLQY